MYKRYKHHDKYNSQEEMVLRGSRHFKLNKRLSMDFIKRGIQNEIQYVDCRSISIVSS